ncbi:hypothetical protein MMC26_006854 [Xylographa opegraphella]|nr:hypothetical protein [Xylographa opegraphella]
MRFLTLLLVDAIVNFAPVSSLVSCNGFPLVAPRAVAQIAACNRAVEALPVWRIDIGNAGANGHGSVILHPQVQHFNVPASFQYSDLQNFVRCGVQVSVFRPEVVNGVPRSTGIAVPMSDVTLAFYVWNPAQHAAGRVVHECLQTRRRLGMSSEFVTIPAHGGSPEMLVEISVMVKVESTLHLYQV